MDPHETLTLKPGMPLRGITRVPGDKSISHRSILLGALGDGATQVRGWLAAGDTEATLAAVQQLLTSNTCSNVHRRPLK